MQPTNVSRRDYLYAAIIGEAVAWLTVFTAQGAQVPLPFLKLATNILPIAFPILSIIGLAVAHWLSRFIASLVQIAKFVLVGALNTFIDLGVLNLLILWKNVSQGTPFVAFKAASFTAAVVNSYFWNKYWTFQAGQTQERSKEFGEFLVVSIVGLLINIGVAGFLNNFVGAVGSFNQNQWATISAIAATFAALFWNFVGYKFIVFKQNQTKTFQV